MKSRNEFDLLGNYSGQIGPLVIYKLNGQTVVRTKGKRKKPYSVKELTKQKKFILLNDFLKSLDEFYNAGFELEAIGTTSNAYNKALQHNYDCITGNYPDLYIDYAKVLVTKGNMPVTEQIAVKTIATGIEVVWDSECDQINNRADDQVMIVATYTDKNGNSSTEYTTAGALRAAGKEVLALNAAFRKSTVHVYVSFISSNRKKIADSKYMGAITWNIE